MSAALHHSIAAINTQLAALIPRTQAALSGDSAFTVDQVRALSRPITAMAPFLAAGNLAAPNPQIAAQLQIYKAHLRQLQPLLENLRLMLLAKRSEISSGQAQLQAVSQWATALSRTNDL